MIGKDTKLSADAAVACGGATSTPYDEAVKDGQKILLNSFLLRGFEYALVKQ